jgi:type 2A phosphatase activator TIP41
MCAQGNMYFEAIADVLRSKRGPFQEHSPMLFELSSLKSWEDIHHGLVKMWKGEVLAKFPVAQHFVFGKSLPVTWQTSVGDGSSSSSTGALRALPASPFAPSAAATAAAAMDPMHRYFGRGAENKSAPDKRDALSYTLVDGGIAISGWRIQAATGKISSEAQLDGIRASNPTALDFPLPEMLFGSNALGLNHFASGFGVAFSAAPALAGCKLAPGQAPDRVLFKVAIAETWSKRTDAEGRPIPVWREDFDWTFTTFYSGDVAGGGGKFKPTPRRIDYEHLKLREDILFSTEVVLFEDDLFDTGVSRLSVKVRVMPSCFFCLCRLFLRVDGNFVRVVDARFFHVFGNRYVLRETSHREATFAALGNVQSKDLIDANYVASVTPLVQDPVTMEAGW